MHLFLPSIVFLSFSLFHPPKDGSTSHLHVGYEPEPLAKYGTLDVAFEYDSGEQRLAVTVTAATDIPALKQTGNIAWQVGDKQTNTLLLYLYVLHSPFNVFPY